MSRSVLLKESDQGLIARAYKKYCAGDPLTDDECRMGDKMVSLGHALIIMGPEFRLAGQEFLRVGGQLQEFTDRRRRDK